MKFIDKLKRFHAFDELLKQLIIRDIKLKYRRSYLGYLWSILNPLMLMTVLVIVFSNLFRFDIPNLPLYLITGQVIFNFMTEATNMSVTSIIGNAALIKKTYVPKYIFTVSRVGSSLVNLIFSLGALLLVMIFTKAEFTWNLLFFPFVILQVFIFSLGLSLWLSAASVFFRDLQYLWGVFLSMWMYLTPLFYPVNIIPESYQTLYKTANPMYWYIEQFRDIVLYAKFPNVNSIYMGTAIAFLVLFLGAWYFNKKQDEFIIEDIREELMETGFIKRRSQDKRHKRKKAECYLASDGQTIIMVGRNNLQNDELTFKIAKKGELWFHAKDIPGSHVLIKDNLNPSDEVKTDAAELAAYYSKARLSNLVQVDMIEAKKLNKPSGAKPGFVTYTGQKTLRVTPNAEKINSMRIQ